MNNEGKSLIDRFIDLSLEAFEGHDDEFFEIEDIDKEPYLTERLNHIKRLRLKSMSTVQRNKNEKQLHSASELIKKILESGDKMKIGKLSQVLGSNRALALYHNLDTLDKQEIEEMCRDMNILDIIEGLEKPDEKSEK